MTPRGQKRLRTAGLTGAGVAGGVAGVLTANRAAVRRAQRRPELVDPVELDMPADAIEEFVPMPDGVRIRVVSRGPTSGRPVVLLHGVTLSADVWPYQVLDLSDAGFRVFALDQRGHGRSASSAAGRGRLNLDGLASDLVDMMAFYDLWDAIVVGHSMGGMAALRLLARDPELAAGKGRVTALALVATSAHPVADRGVPIIASLAALARPVLASASGLVARLPGPTLPASDLAFSLARFTFGQQASPRQVMFTGEMASEAPIRVSAELLLDIVRFNGVADLADIQVPTTIVVGDHDVMTPLSQSEVLAHEIAESELVVLRGCGHMVMLERPADLDDAIVALAERSGSGGGGGLAGLAGTPRKPWREWRRRRVGGA